MHSTINLKAISDKVTSGFERPPREKDNPAAAAMAIAIAAAAVGEREREGGIEVEV